MSPQGGLCGSGGHGRAESAVQPGGGSPAPCPRGQRAALQGRWRRSRQRGSCPPVAPAGAPPPARLCPRPDTLPANFVLLQWPEAPPATSAAPPAVPAGSRPSAGRGNRGTADGGLGSEIGPGGCRLLGCTRRPSCRVLTCPSNKGANPVLGLHPRDLAASPRPRLLTQPRVRARGAGWLGFKAGAWGDTALLPQQEGGSEPRSRPSVRGGSPAASPPPFSSLGGSAGEEEPTVFAAAAFSRFPGPVWEQVQLPGVAGAWVRANPKECSRPAPPGRNDQVPGACVGGCICGQAPSHPPAPSRLSWSVGPWDVWAA